MAFSFLIFLTFDLFDIWAQDFWSYWQMAFRTIGLWYMWTSRHVLFLTFGRFNFWPPVFWSFWLLIFMTFELKIIGLIYRWPLEQLNFGTNELWNMCPYGLSTFYSQYWRFLRTEKDFAKSKKKSQIFLIFWAGKIPAFFWKFFF